MNKIDFISRKFQLPSDQKITFISILGAINKHTALQIQKLYETFEKDERVVIISLADVHYVDSTGLGILVTFQQQCQEKEVDLKLCMISQKIDHLFRMLGMSSCF